MKKLLFTVLVLLSSAILFGFLAAPQEEEIPDGDAENQTEAIHQIDVINYVRKADRNTEPSVDHTKFEILQQEFASAHDVTAACLSCHTERDKEIMATSHWKWEREEEIEGRGVVALGKKNILNNFCIGIAGSEKTCTRCHIGYGWADKDFDFSDPLNIDCLVCHDNSGTYEKDKGAAGYPKASVDLNYVAQSVGSPTRENCGVCHYWGGGGNNVKHGDLDKALKDVPYHVDVHMTTEGEDMDCIECHVTDKHQMAGKLYALSSENHNRATCEQCHTARPHKDQILDDHNIRVACQTCHIPIYAKVNGTKMIWDWSTAGRLDDHGKPLHENDADGNHNYLSIKGNFVYDDHVVPEYYWFNGIANHHLLEDKIDTVPVQMNTLYGSYNDKGANQKSTEPAKIWPVKVHRGKQLYDTEHMTLIQPKLWAATEGQGAYWKDFDWDKAAQVGMEYVEQEYSGSYDFVETEMYWPLNHMVSPAEQSLTCKDCHTRNDGRLAKLTDFYLPGRDYYAGLDTFGFGVIILALIGVFVHGFLRIVMRKNCLHNN